MSRLGEFLLKRSLLNQEQLQRALNDQRLMGGILAQHLVRLEYVTEEDLIQLLQKEYRLPIVDPSSLDILDETLALIPPPLAAKHILLPISLVGSTLTIAMADPSNLVAINEVKFVTGYDIKMVLSAISALRKALEGAYDTGSAAYEDVLTQLESENVELVKGEEEIDLKELERATEEAPVVKLVNALLTDAIKKRASDIHIEPFEKMLRVRFRIDGVLYEIMKPPMNLKNALISRVKIMAALDIAERRLPQDGRIKLRLPGSREMAGSSGSHPDRHQCLRLHDRQYPVHSRSSGAVRPRRPLFLYDGAGTTCDRRPASETLDALAITARTAGNRVVEKAIFATRVSISEGKTIAEPLAQSKVFAPMVCQMIAVGETTGALDQMLGKIAEFYEDEVDAAITNLTSLMEPLVISFLGVVIGGLVISMYLPIFQLGAVVGG